MQSGELSKVEDIPEFPARIIESTVRNRNMWAAFWEGEEGTMVARSHWRVVARYLRNWVELEGFYKRWDAFTEDEQIIPKNVTRNSGGLEIHPLHKLIKDSEAELRVLEIQLGLSPKAAAQLGREIGEAQLTFENLRLRDPAIKSEIQSEAIKGVIDVVPE